jgi:phage baseplate assembly protein W
MGLKGLKFPFSISAQSGRTSAVENKAQIESCLKLLLAVDKGSRPMRRDYGVGIGTLLQEPNDDILQNLVRRFIFEEVMRWEPRVVLKDVEFISNKDLGVLHVVLFYDLSDTGEANQIDFSFGLV